MSVASVLALIQIAQDLAEVINAEVQASDDAEVKAAWQKASAMYQKGFDDAYPADSVK